MTLCHVCHKEPGSFYGYFPGDGETYFCGACYDCQPEHVRTACILIDDAVCCEDSMCCGEEFAPAVMEARETPEDAPTLICDACIPKYRNEGFALTPIK